MDRKGSEQKNNVTSWLTEVGQDGDPEDQSRCQLQKTVRDTSKTSMCLPGDSKQKIYDKASIAAVSCLQCFCQ